MVRTFLSIISGFGLFLSFVIGLALKPPYSFIDSTPPIIMGTLVSFMLFFILLGLLAGNLRQVLLGYTMKEYDSI
jgi:hypothetical protein